MPVIPCNTFRKKELILLPAGKLGRIRIALPQFSIRLRHNRFGSPWRDISATSHPNLRVMILHHRSLAHAQHDRSKNTSHTQYLHHLEAIFGIIWTDGGAPKCPLVYQISRRSNYVCRFDDQKTSPLSPFLLRLSLLTILNLRTETRTMPVAGEIWRNFGN